MKNKYFILPAILLIAGSLLTGCNNNREKTTEDASESIEQANQNLKDTQAQYEREWKQFKSDVELKISTNEKRIDEFKKKMETMSEKFKAKYENKVLTLEQKNIGLKKKLNNYKYEGKHNWEEFKQEFNNDLDSLGNAINDVFTDKDNQ